MKKAEILAAKERGEEFAVHQHSWSQGRERAQVVEHIVVPGSWQGTTRRTTLDKLREEYPGISFWVHFRREATSCWIIRIVDDPKAVEYVIARSQHIDCTWPEHETRRAAARAQEAARREFRANQWAEYDQLVEAIENGPYSELFDLAPFTPDWRKSNTPPTSIKVSLLDVARHSKVRQ